MEPRYPNDLPGCTFLGVIRNYDAYFCTPEQSFVVIWQSAEGHQFTQQSSLLSGLSRYPRWTWSGTLQQMYKMAKEKGVL